VQAVCLVYGDGVELLAAGAAEDEREGRALAPLGGAGRTDALPAVVEVRAGRVEAGGDSAALGEEGVEFGDWGWENGGWRMENGGGRMKNGGGRREEGLLDFLGGDVEVVGELGEGPGAGRECLDDGVDERGEVGGQGGV